MNTHAHPCPDCKWGLYVLTGQPVLMVRCAQCQHWYATHIQEARPIQSIAGEGYELTYTIDYDRPQKEVNAAFRCDCIAEQLFFKEHQHICLYCMTKDIPDDVFYDRVVRTRKMHMGSLLRNLDHSSYKHSKLPAYTIQRRCGALPEYLEEYLQLITKDQREATLAYQEMRLALRGEKNEETR